MARRLHRAAHKNSDRDNGSGSVAIRILPPRDNVVPLAGRLGGRHRQPEQLKELTQQKAL
jgi:hypothetical protein